MRYLKKNTAVIVTVGPFLDKTDGVTLETGLTITNERISLVVDLDDGSAPTLVLDNVTGATSGTANDLNYITNCDAGLMQLELAAANVNYSGRAFLTITDAANHCPVFHEFMILPANVYDSLMGTDKLDVNAAEHGGTSQTGRDIGASVLLSSGTGTGQLSITSGVVSATVPDTQKVDVNTIKTQAVTCAAGVTVSPYVGNATAALSVSAAGRVDVGLWLGTACATPTVAGVPEVDLTHINGTAASGSATVDANVVSVSGDTTAADNLELAYDGTGYAGGTIKPKVDLDTIKTQTITCAAGVTILASVGTAATSTAQTGDTYALANGASGFVAIYNFVDCLPASWVVPPLAAANADAVWAALTSTHDATGSFGLMMASINYAANTVNGNVGTAGAGLTAVPWNAAWDAEVQSECDDAITANTLVKRILPAVAGTVTGAGTGTEVFVYGGVTMTVTVDVNGNRSVVAWS
jgi:hypothetical protein